ncbi:MAG: hypothetical protein ABI846_05455 [Rudaea sp.]
MPGHDLKKLERELQSVLDLSGELIKLIYKKGYTTPREFALVSGVTEGLLLQLKTLTTVSRDIVQHAGG